MPFIHEVRNYFMNPAILKDYRPWAKEFAAPGLVKFFGRYGGEVIGFWMASDESENENKGTRVDSVKASAVPGAANVTWVIRWGTMKEREQGWASVREDPEFKVLFDQRNELVSDAANQYWHQEIRFCEDFTRTYGAKARL